MSVSADSSGKATREPSEVITIPYVMGYVEPRAYEGKGWTLNPATLKDVIVLGECDADPQSEDFSINKLIKENVGNCGIIRQVIDARNKPYLPIIKVVAR